VSFRINLQTATDGNAQDHEVGEKRERRGLRNRITLLLLGSSSL